MPLENVSNIILVLSGKGGVGKSSVTLQLALSLTSQGHNVGILDIDLTGPSIPRLLGLEDQKVTQAPGGWLPVQVHDRIPPPSSNDTNGTNGTDPPPPPSGPSPSHSPSNLSAPNASTLIHTNNTQNPSTSPSPPPRGSLHAISLAFLLPSRSSAVIWRGPKKTAMIRQFISDVLWPPSTTYLLIDTPPGTSDEHIAIVEELHKHASTASGASRTDGLLSPGNTDVQDVMLLHQPRLAGAVVVTTPQAISVADVRKELNFCVKTSVPVLGVIENMSGYMCPCCGEISHIFSKGGGEVMSRETGVRFLGSVPVSTEFGEMVEGGGGEGELVERYRRCALSGVFEGFVKEIEQLVDAAR